MIPNPSLDTTITRKNILAAQIKRAKECRERGEEFNPLTSEEIADAFHRCHTERHVRRASRLLDAKLMAQVAEHFASK